MAARVYRWARATAVRYVISMLRSLALVAALTATVAAAPYKETLSKSDVTSIVSARQAALPKVAPDVSQCNTFLDTYNKGPEHDIEQADLAAKCFRTAGSLGLAIQNWIVFLRYAPNGPNASDAWRELGSACEAAALFDRAADAYETFAKKYGADKHAKDLMIRATCIRRQLGDTHADDDFAYLNRSVRPALDSATLCDYVRPIAMPTAAP